MKLIGHAIGVLVVSGAIALVIAPAFSQAQTNQAVCNFSNLSNVALTLQQCAQLNQIDVQTRVQLQSVLTPAQLDELQTALDRNGNVRPDVITALNLSPQQQTELMQILLSTHQQVTDVLTPKQIEQVRQNLPFHP